MSFFSIVIPAYNQPKLLSETMAALLSQTFIDYEVIVVDDGSSNNEVKSVIKSFSLKYDRIRPIYNDINSGLAHARNDGLKVAQGKYVIFLDHDDIYFPSALQIFYDAIIEFDSPVLVVGQSASEIPSFNDILTSFQNTRQGIECYLNYYDYRSKQPNWWFVPSGAAILKSELLRCGGFWESRLFCEDIDLWQRLGDAHGFIKINKPHIFYYKLHDGNNHKNTPMMAEGFLKMVDRENNGHYPGGSGMRIDRVKILCFHGRKLALEAARDGLYKLACQIYSQTFRWNLELGRLRFLILAPLIGVIRLVFRRVFFFRSSSTNFVIGKWKF